MLNKEKGILNREERRKLNKDKKLQKEITQEAEKLQKELHNDWNSLRKQIAVCCFTESFDSFLMWSHYANCYNGICLEYDISEINSEINNKGCLLSQVKYTDKLIKIMDYITKEDLINNNYNKLLKVAFDSVLSKQLQWSYEKEWRIVSALKNENERYVSMPTPKSIFIGFKVDNIIKVKIKDIAKQLGINEVKETTISLAGYKLIHTLMG